MWLVEIVSLASILGAYEADLSNLILVNESIKFCQTFNFLECSVCSHFSHILIPLSFTYLKLLEFVSDTYSIDGIKKKYPGKSLT